MLAYSYSIVTGILLIASFAVLNSIPMPAGLVILTNSFLAMFWVFTWHKLYSFVKTIIKLKFVKSSHLAIIEKTASALRQAQSYGDIVKIVSLILEEEINVKNAHFFFQDKEIYLKWDLISNRGMITKEDNLIKGLLGQRDIISLEKGNELNGILCVPSFSEKNQLLAFFTVGQKYSEEDYTEREKKLLRVIAALVATTLEYIVKPFTEMTEEIETSKEQLEEAEKELETSHRLASLGTLTAGITHEIKNPVATIQLSAEILAMKTRGNLELDDQVQKILRHCGRIETVIEKTLAMAKKKETEKVRKPIDLNNLIEEVMKLVPLNDCQLIKELNPIPPILGDSEEIGRVIINLAQNAVQAMTGGGTLSIRTYSSPDKVYLQLSDTGCGIPEKNLSKIFDPFFTTKEDGTGLGLSVIYRIIKEHGGDISVDSEEGRGTAFKIELCPQTGAGAI